MSSSRIDYEKHLWTEGLYGYAFLGTLSGSSTIQIPRHDPSTRMTELYHSYYYALTELLYLLFLVLPHLPLDKAFDPPRASDRPR